MLILVGLVLVLSTGLFFYYMDLVCQEILRRQFVHGFFHSGAKADRMEFPFAPKASEESVPLVDCRQLAADFLALTYLLKIACRARHRYSHEERLLIMDFRLVFLLLTIARLLGLSARAAVRRLTAILEFFAYEAQARAWKAPIDVLVEYNGTVYLVYPLSDRAREWFEMNTFRNARRFGDIQLIEPRHLDGLVKALLDRHLTVLPSSYFSNLRNIQRKASETSAR